MEEVRLAKLALADEIFAARIYSMAAMISKAGSTRDRLLKISRMEEEYGVKEEKLERPAAAGFYMGLAYLLSAFLPILPYLIGLSIIPAMLLSLLIAGLSLSFTGLIIAISADLPIKRKILEMILAGFGSAVITFIMGKTFSLIFGVSA